MATSRTLVPWLGVMVVCTMLLTSVYQLSVQNSALSQENAEMQAALRKAKALRCERTSQDAAPLASPSKIQIETGQWGLSTTEAATPLPTEEKKTQENLPPRKLPYEGSKTSESANIAPAVPSDGKRNRVAIITLIAQLNKGAGKGISGRATWMHPMSFYNKYTYAKKWNYDVIVEDNSMVDPSRDVLWSKIPVWKKWLPKYDWLVWIDMDAFFVNYDLDLERFMKTDKDVVLAKDWNGINTGVMFIRNSKFTYEMLDKMWNTPKAWWFPWEEQSALMNLLNPKKNPKEAAELDKHFLYPKQRELNSYPEGFSYGNANAKYVEGDFIVHFPNCKSFRNCQSLITKYFTLTNKKYGLTSWKDAPAPLKYYPGDPDPYASNPVGGDV